MRRTKAQKAAAWRMYTRYHEIMAGELPGSAHFWDCSRGYLIGELVEAAFGKECWTLWKYKAYDATRCLAEGKAGTTKTGE